LNDPALLEEAKKTKNDIAYLGGEEIFALVRQSLTMPPELKDLMSKATQG